jgi:hypothetical protein
MFTVLNRTYLFLVLISLCILIFSCHSAKKFTDWENKTVAARYSGGHHWDVSLTLYTDSTFQYRIVRDVMALTTKTRGAYLKTDSSISLYVWKSKITRNKVKEDVFRIRGNDVLMYTEEQEQSENSSFYKAYFTLSKDK